MEMAKVRTCDLIGAALDWAVAKAVGYELRGGAGFHHEAWFYGHKFVCAPEKWNPSTDWSQGGPLIHSHEVAFLRNSIKTDPNIWLSVLLDGSMSSGPTHLIAACRAIVSAHLGDSVDVPAELVGGGHE